MVDRAAADDEGGEGCHFRDRLRGTRDWYTGAKMTLLTITAIPFNGTQASSLGIRTAYTCNITAIKRSAQKIPVIGLSAGAPLSCPSDWSSSAVAGKLGRIDQAAATGGRHTRGHRSGERRLMLHGSLVVLLEQNDTDQTGYGVRVGENADEFGAALGYRGVNLYP